MATPEKEQCQCCGIKKLGTTNFQGCEHKFCPECESEIEDFSTFKCPLCDYLTQPTRLDLPNDSLQPRKRIKTGTEAINFGDAEAIVNVDVDVHSNCQQCTKRRKSTKAQNMCLGCHVYLCNLDAKKHGRLGDGHRQMLRFKEDPPTAEGVRQASRTTQGTVKAKEAGQKTKTARPPRVNCNPCMMERILRPAIYMCTECWEKLCEDCHKNHNRAFEHHYIVGIGAHLKPEEKATSLNLPSSKSTYDDICKTHNEKLSFGCTRCNFLVCQKCYEDELLIEEECASDDKIHFFHALDLLEVMLKERMMFGMHYIQKYAELVAELTESVYGCKAPDVLSVVDKLKEKVSELSAIGQDTTEEEKTDEPELTESADTQSEDGEPQDDAGNDE